MTSHMGVQLRANKRNSNVEFFVHYILMEFGNRLKQNGDLTSFELHAQRLYSSDIASDVWDHYFTGSQRNGRRLELWCQTTCYKGNDTGKPEPNKTYEVRETIVEGLSIREHFSETSVTDCRSIHFTVGDKRYTYKWFLDLKSAAYDKSLYIGRPRYDIFSDIDLALCAKFTEDEKANSLSNSVKQNSVLGTHIEAAVRELIAWWNDEQHKKSALADLQWALIRAELDAREGSWPDIEAVKGRDIKGRVNAAIFKEDPGETDSLISRTAIKLLKKNPFLQCAIDVTSNWEQFCAVLVCRASSATDAKSFLKMLWSTPLPQRLVLRRLLLRIHTNQSVDYVQDRDINGITEHNIYSGDHSVSQSDAICDQILAELNSSGLFSIEDILSAIISNGKRLINQARWFEAKNGTELKPSFDYVELFLVEAGFKVESPRSAGIPVTGYHAEITSERVRPYTNLKVVKDRRGKVVCVLKAKFFRIQEFPRRCKEEAFVGLTLKYQLSGESFSKRFALPLVMYIDMASDCVPPSYAIKRLMSFGWQVVFSPEELITKLSEKSLEVDEKIN